MSFVFLFCKEEKNIINCTVTKQNVDFKDDIRDFDSKGLHYQGRK